MNSPGNQIMSDYGYCHGRRQGRAQVYGEGKTWFLKYGRHGTGRWYVLSAQGPALWGSLLSTLCRALGGPQWLGVVVSLLSVAVWGAMVAHLWNRSQRWL
jgi:hypothetical protein